MNDVYETESFDVIMRRARQMRSEYMVRMIGGAFRAVFRRKSAIKDQVA